MKKNWVDQIPKTFAERQALVRQLLEQSAQQYEGINSRLFDFALRELERLRLELTDLLVRYTEKGNTVAIERLNALLKELDRLKQQTLQTMTDTLHQVIKESAQAGTDAGNAALTQATGLNPDELYIGTFDFNSINDNVFQYVVNRYGADGLVLSDRIWRLTNEQYDQIEAIVRSGIINGTSVNTMVRQIKNVYDIEAWKIKRMVVTEGNVAYRTATAYVAQQSRVVKGLRIHRGRANNPKHRCTQLEQIDRYGLGKGVYLPTDPEVLNPHINCTGYTTYELVSLDEIIAM